MKMEKREYIDFCNFLEDATGIGLNGDKQYLVSARVRSLMNEYDCATLTDLMYLVSLPEQRMLHQRVINAMTTNETYWFRDNYPFNYFKEQYVALWFEKTNNRQPLRVWSAACSYGQEPYSLAICLDELQQECKKNRGIQYEILATDISNDVIQQASAGMYNHLAISRGISSSRLRKYFYLQCDDQWLISSFLKENVDFRVHNLMDNYGRFGTFDIIFCRNVLIYFSFDFKNEVLKKLHRSLKKGGYLILGASEGISEASEYFEEVYTSPGIIYRAI